MLLLTGACAGPPAASVPTPGPASADVPASAAGPNGEPPPDGYFALRPVGSFATLPDDEQAAATVRRTAWEPRPENDAANKTPAPPGTHVTGYAGMLNSHAVFGRVTGDFTGTTDEVIQWAAVKWGLPDELIRGEAVVESSWYQGLQDPSGAPINQRGYGDFGDCGGSPPGAPYGPRGPSSFGLLQVKWCSMENRPATGTGGWPWTERSTAYAVDLYAAVIRGCYEGWDVWLGANYRAGDLWGCVGRWFAGDWHSSTGDAYADRVQQAVAAKPWLSWPNT
ncbi:hypothetical protein ACR9E3_11585 [Actinomycetospora sp. C-140]